MKKKTRYVPFIKKTGGMRYLQKGQQSRKQVLPSGVIRVGMQCLLAVLWVLSMLFLFGDIFLINQIGKSAFIGLSVLAAAVTVSFSCFKKAGKWIIPVISILAGTICCWKQFYPGVAGIIRLVTEKINFYYDIQLVSGFEQYQNLEPAVTVAACFIAVFSVFQIYFLVVRKRMAVVLLPPVLLMILGFAVGYAPSFRALICFALAVTGSFCYRAAGRMEEKQLEYLRQKAVCLFLVTAVVVTSLVFKIAEPEAEKAVAGKSKIEKAAQDMVTDAAMSARSLLMRVPFGKDIFKIQQPGCVSNTAPEYEDKPVMEVTTLQLPDDTVYLRGYVGDYYKNGSWKTYDADDFVTAMQEVDDSLNEQTAGQQVQHILAYTQSYDTYYWDTTYRMQYLDDKDAYAYLPYYTTGSYYQDGTGTALTKDVLMDGDRTVLRNGNDVIEVDGTIRNSMAYLTSNDTLSEGTVSEILEDWTDRGYDEDGFRSNHPEEQWKFIKKYNEYTAKYTSVPDNLTRIQELGDQLEEEYESDYSDFVNNRFTVDGTFYDGICNFKEIYAVYLVKRELAECEYNLELDNVPWGQDVTEHFLFDTKEGFCQHFASAGTLLLRQMGIKARYVSGYAVSPSKFKKDGNGNYTAEVLDNQAHAWTEVYMDNIGWIPVEMTPGNKTGIDRLDIQQEEDSITIRMNDGRKTDMLTLMRSDYQNSADDGSWQDDPDGNTQETNAPDTEKPDMEKQNTAMLSTESENTEKSDMENADAPIETDKTAKTGEEHSGKGMAAKTRLLLVVILLLSVLAVCYYFRNQKKQGRNRKESYKRMICRTSNQIYHMLRRKGIVNAKAKSDDAFRRQLSAYEGICMEEKERYLKILEMAAYSQKKLTEEDLQFVQKFYQNIKKKRK